MPTHLRDATVQIRPDWCRIEARLPDGETAGEADVYIFDEIGYWGTTAREFAEQVADLDVGRITLHLNSPGGDAWDGVAIANVLRRHQARVDVVVEGLAASAASLIAMAGDHITMAPSSMMMIHDAAGFAWGDADTMRESAEILDKLSDSYADAYARRAGGDREQWRATMRAETWYTAAEAVAAGLADEWDESLPAVAHAQFRRVKARRAPSPPEAEIRPPLPAQAQPDPEPDQPAGPNHHQQGALALLTSL